MENEIIAIGPDEKFKFACIPEVPCFNECCQDLNQFLTPYDILRLKNNLKLKSWEFLEKYTIRHLGPETGLPVIVLRQDPASGMKCPFVTPKGCSVYDDRPSSCRIYPLARLATRSRETGKITEHYALMKEPHCLGFKENKSWSPLEWIKSQGLEIYNEMNDMMMETIARKNRLHPEPLDMKEQHIFHIGCYDIDRFGIEVFEKNLLNDLKISEDLMEKAEKDETELLKLGFYWINTTLFPESVK